MSLRLIKQTLFALALLLCASQTQAATCFAVAAGNWNDANTWASGSAGTPGTCAATGNIPKNATDIATLDASSGGGTITLDIPLTGANAIAQITMGAYTGTLNLNNNNVTLTTAFSLTGAGTKTLTMGSGTITLSATTGTIWDCGTCTNLTLTANTSTILIATTTATSTRTMSFGGKNYNAITVNDATPTVIPLFFSGTGSTIATFTFTSARFIQFANAAAITVTNAFSFNGTSSAPVIFGTAGPTPITLTVAGAVTFDWAALLLVTKAGAGTINATNAFNLGTTSFTSITPPSSGSSRCIGC